MRQSLLVVVLVALEDEVLAALPLRQFVGPRADRVLAEIGAVFLDFFLWNDEGEVERDYMQHGRVRRGELDLHRIIVRRGDAGELGGLAGLLFGEALDRGIVA